METSTVGNENVKKALTLLASLIAMIDQIGAVSGLKAKAMKLALLPGIALEAMLIDFSKIKGEYQDLQAEEKAEAFKVFNEKFSLNDKDLEKKIEMGLEVLADLAVVGVKVYDLIKAFKTENVSMPAGANQAALNTPSQT